MSNKLKFSRTYLNLLSRLNYATSNIANINFNDSKKAFETKNSWELLRSLLVFKMCSSNLLVNNMDKIIQMSQKIFGKRIFEYMVKKTIYGHFVAGVDQNEVKRLIDLNKQVGVQSILNYSVEEDVHEAIDIEKLDSKVYEARDEKEWENNVNKIKELLNTSAFCMDKEEGLVSLKLTALAPPHLLLHMTEILNQLEQIFEEICNMTSSSSTNSKIEKDIIKFFTIDSFINYLDEKKVILSEEDKINWFKKLDTDQDGKIDKFDWIDLKNFEYNMANLFVVKNQDGQETHLIPYFSSTALESLQKLFNRLDNIVKYSEMKQVSIIIDAEQTYLQHAIRLITLELMKRYNKHNRIVYNTSQAYLKCAHDYLLNDMKFTEKYGVKFGAKIVRGAYLTQERERAVKRGYEDPICENYEATTAMYNKCLNEALNYITSRERGQVLIIVASHNCDTVKYAIEKCHEMKINPQDKSIYFAQLLGMRDRITFVLGQVGYPVYKCMPYGPIHQTLPYLVRRAIENRAVLNQSNDEINIIWIELKRRLKTHTWLSYPIKTT